MCILGALGSIGGCLEGGVGAFGGDGIVLNDVLGALGGLGGLLGVLGAL